MKMKIFVLHYSKLIERKQNIINQFIKHNILDYEFIESYDKDTLQAVDKILFTENFKPSMISLMLKHFYVYKEIKNKYDYALIFEDDVILSDKFMEKLEHYMSQLPNNFDMLFLGNGCNLHIEHNKLIPNCNIYLKDNTPLFDYGHLTFGISRCSDSYIVSNKCAKTLCNYLNNLHYKINLPSDWWINLAAKDTNLIVYWAEPTIVSQGSQSGIYKSSH